MSDYFRQQDDPLTPTTIPNLTKTAYKPDRSSMTQDQVFPDESPEDPSEGMAVNIMGLTASGGE